MKTLKQQLKDTYVIGQDLTLYQILQRILLQETPIERDSSMEVDLWQSGNISNKKKMMLIWMSGIPATINVLSGSDCFIVTPYSLSQAARPLSFTRGVYTATSTVTYN